MESVFGEVEARVQHLSDRLRPLRTLGEHLSRNLSEIRELIKQARKQASSVSVNTPPHSYTPEKTNELSAIFKVYSGTVSLSSDTKSHQIIQGTHCGS